MNNYRFLYSKNQKIYGYISKSTFFMILFSLIIVFNNPHLFLIIAWGLILCWIISSWYIFDVLYTKTKIIFSNINYGSFILHQFLSVQLPINTDKQHWCQITHIDYSNSKISFFDLKKNKNFTVPFITYNYLCEYNNDK